MNIMKKGIAVVLCAAMCMPSLPVLAAAGTGVTEKAVSSDAVTGQKASDEDLSGQDRELPVLEGSVRFHTGRFEYYAALPSEIEALAEEFELRYGAAVQDFEDYADNMAAVSDAKALEHYTAYDADGRCRIPVEEDAFFPYEVQFSYDGEVKKEWFLTRDDTVTAGGHEFYLDAPVSGNAVTQMNLNVGGDVVTVYPKEKEFAHDQGGQTQETSLLPLKEVYLSVDLTGYSPVELTKVSVGSIFTGSQQLPLQDYYVMWKRNWLDGDTYETCPAGGSMDLSRYTSSGLKDTTQNTWEMIVGKKDQLEASNIRYLVSAEVKSSEQWLVPEAGKDINGTRSVVPVIEYAYNDYNNSYYAGEDKDGWSRYLRIQFAREKTGSYYLSLKQNQNFQAGEAGTTVRVFDGKWNETELTGAKDITAQVWGTDMSGAGSGYQLNLSESQYMQSKQWITIVSYKNGSVTGCLPVQLILTPAAVNSIGIQGGLFFKNEYGNIVYPCGSAGDTNVTDGVSEEIYYMYKGFLTDAQYTKKFYYYNKDGFLYDPVRDAQAVMAFVGKYDSIAAAGNAENIAPKLFGDGYTTDYSKGVTFSIFIGSDGTGQKKYYYRYRTMEKPAEQPSEPSLNASAYLNLRGAVLKKADGTESSVPVRIFCSAPNGELDSYGESNFYTIFADSRAEDGTETDLTRLALTFSASANSSVFTEGGAAETSGEKAHDFSKSAVQYTVQSQDKKNSRNYFVRIFKADDASRQTPELYINSLWQEGTDTKNVNGVIQSTREIFLDSYHENRHNILAANVSCVTMSALKVTLTGAEGKLKLDDYWTLKGENGLSGFTSLKETKDSSRASYGSGYMQNLAMVSIQTDESYAGEMDDTQDLGTLTFSSGQNEIMTLKLTGIIGDPRITTKTIPAATQYVPYGIMIMNNNRYYSWNRVTYSYEGKLPEGMELSSQGELYGVPKETGTFPITVKMNNSSGKPDSRQFTLTVLENTDSNVENAQDAGYQLEEKIDGIYDIDADGNYQILSAGQFSQFFDLYIDGEKMVKDQDYWAKEGSTRITIAAQSLPKTDQRHTIGVEFRVGGEKGQVKAAAQNYYGGSHGGSGGSSGSGSGGSSGGSSGGNPGAAFITRPSVTPPNPETKPPAPSVPDTGTNPPVQPQPQKPPVSRVIQHAETYTVKAGDTLKSIAKKHYGKATLWKRIYDANKDKIQDSGNLKAGTKLVIPALSYTVKKGDTIQSIAKKYYGAQSKWKQIYNTNRDVLKSPEQLQQGMKLVLPVPVVRTIYKVQKGDTLQSIAQDFYGDTGRWELIYQANKSKADKSGKVRAGRTLLVPALSYTVKKGDTVESIAKKYYGAQGKRNVIYDANKDVIPASRKIGTGDKLVLPVPLCRTVYTVKNGDTLKSIAKKYYGKSSKWKKIRDANTGKVSDSGKVKAGRRLVIPAVNCTAEKGDSLKSLAKKYYGTKSSWTKIYNANRDIITASKKIKPGMKLVIPVPAEL